MGKLRTFPVSMKVAGRRILIVGGGAEALAKAHLAVKTEAEVLVVAQKFDADFSGLELVTEERLPNDSDFENTALVFVADHGLAGTEAKILARAHKVPLNSVDVPDECDFYTPAIVDRSPLTVAISTEGEAPVLARLVRARIEALLDPNLGSLARLAGSLRAKVEQLLPNLDQRRRFFERLMGLEVTGTALAEKAEQLLVEAVDGSEDKGFVSLVGAGPGAIDLLTLRAQRLLQEADVIVHDQLVETDLVEMGRRDAERIAVGKAKGHHSFSQARINALLVRLAREGKKVVRLKSGDPMVFGRAGEEIAALRAAGISYAIVPGVTSALAAAADNAVPVTLRKVSSGFVVATAHGANDSDLKHWAALATSGMTLALYMGKSIAGDVAKKLLTEGLAAKTPVGIVLNAGRRTKSSHFGTVGQLANAEIAFAEGPAIILIGDAIAEGDWQKAEELGLAAAAREVA